MSVPATESGAVREFLFVNQSCHRRQEEIGTAKRFFLINGFAEGSDLKTADFIVFFTCAFSQSKVVDMLDEIEQIRSAAKNGCEIIVGSCLPKTNKAELKKVFSGETITPTDFSALNRLPGVTVKIEDIQKLYGSDTACAPFGNQPGSRTLRRRMKALALGATKVLKRAWPALPLERVASRLDADRRMGVSIASGCMRKCSYCAIRFATGRLRSKPLETVTRTISDGIELGYRRFDIFADSIGDYGLDIGTDLGRLLSWFLTNDRDFSLGIYDLHPEAFAKFFNEISSLCALGKMHYLYVPVQSGNARVLALMNRQGDVDDTASKLAEIRRHTGVFLQTSVIVGFPGETDREFQDTVDFLSRVRFNNVFVHFYSDMPNTESSRLPDKIDKAIMLQRLKRLELAGINHDFEATRHEWENVSG